MHLLRKFPLYMLTAVLFCGSVMMAQNRPANAARIVDKIDESQLTVLHGNTHPAAVAKNDQGRVSSDLPMTDLILVLSRSAEKQAEFEKFVADQYDPNSAVFHQWLTPEQVGEKYGPSLTDIATVSSWLASHGLTVGEVTKDRLSIRFSGTAGQVEGAFHTEIHNLQVKGAAHIGNMNDPQIPTALTPVVVGVKALHNFFPKPLHHMGSQVMHDSSTGKWKRVSSTASATVAAEAKPAGRFARPQYGGNDPSYGLFEDVGPYDFASIYNVLPLWNASTPIDGTGQTIAIAGTSSINLSDVNAFRADFGLPTSNAANTPLLKSGNSQSLKVCTASANSNAQCTIDDLIENSLDVEWSGSVAKNAQIILVASYPASASDDNLYDSESYIVNNKIANNNTTVAPIMNVSYGECELGLGTAGNVMYYNLWQQAASEGIAVFVATGDSDAASCDDGHDTSTPYAAQYGLSVSGLASTPFNTAVGGTDLYWCPVTSSSCTSSAATYWNTSNTIPSGATVGYNAKGYVPEVPWNSTCASPFGVQVAKEIATDIGVSGVVDAETACNFAANTTYINYVYNNFNGYNMGTLVDIVGGSGGASNCVVSSTTGTCTTGATSTGTTNNPDTNASQSALTVVNNGWPKPSWQTGVPGIPADGVRDIPDVSFFASDGFLGSAYLICVSQVSACTYSTNVEPYAQEVGGTSVATPAMAGVMALINQKSGVQGGSPAVNKELYALAAKQSYSGCSAESVTNSSSCSFNDIDAGTFTPGYNIATPCIAGSPNCTVSHSGDSIGILSGNYAGTGYDLATGLGSLNVANVVNNWTSAVQGTSAATVTVAPAATSIPVNQSLNVVVTVTSATNGVTTTPTGNVTLSSGTYTSATQTLASGTSTFTIPADSLSGGADTLTVNYAGDSTYAANNGSASVTVTLLTPTVTATPSAASLNTNQALVITGTVSGSTPMPTGTVTVSMGSTPIGAGTLSSGNYSITINPNTFTASGTENLNVQYAGDTNYTSAGTTTSVNENYVAVLPSVVTVSPATSTPDTGSPLVVTVTVSGTGATPTGTVTLTGGGYSLTTATLASGVATFTIPANTFTAQTTTVTLTSSYSGDANYAGGLGSAVVTPVLSQFSVSSTTPATVAPGSSTTASISVTSTTDYSGTVTFTSANCKLTASPTGAVSSPGCALTGNGTVTLTNGAVSGSPVTFTVSTTGTTTPLASLQLPGKNHGAAKGSAKDELVAAATGFARAHAKNAGWFQAAGGTALAALFLFLVPVRTQRWRKAFGALLILATVGLATVGCGGSSGSSGGSSQGVPTVTVTASPTSVAINAPLTVQVSVTGSGSTPTGSVSLSGGGYTSTSETLTAGSASFTIPANSFKSVGSVTLVANYSGDTKYETMNGSGTVTVNNLPTTAGTYTFTVTSTSSPTLPTEPSRTFSVVVN